MNKQYREFFKESEYGVKFVERLNEQISAQHMKAEDDPDHSRDYTQRAKGVREVLDLINSLCAGSKKP